MRIAEPRVIRSLNASGEGIKTFMFVSVWKGITNLNAIEVACLLNAASLVKRDGVVEQSPPERSSHIRVM